MRMVLLRRRSGGLPIDIGTDCASTDGMDEPRPDDETPSVIEGTDAAALGTALPTESAPPGARVDEAETHVPGPTFDGPGRTEKPWSSSLAAQSPQAGVANEADSTSDPLEERPTDDDPG